MKEDQESEMQSNEEKNYWRKKVAVSSAEVSFNYTLTEVTKYIIT